MKKIFNILLLPLLYLTGALAMLHAPVPASGIIAKPSKYSVTDTMDRLEKVAKAKGIIIFARIDNAGEADKAGLKMRPT